MNKIKNNIKKLLVVALLLPLSYLGKASFILGSSWSFFTGVNIFAPIAVALSGVFGGALFLLVRNILLFGTTVIVASTGLPTLVAGYYLKTKSVVLKAGLPLLCMVLFCLHPTGGQAYLYAMLWLISIAVGLSKTENIYLRSLGATFAAHGVGSVIWLYTMPMTSEMWLALIPKVLVERFVFAIGIAIGYQICVKLVRLLQKVSFGGYIKTDPITN